MYITFVDKCKTRVHNGNRNGGKLGLYKTDKADSYKECLYEKTPIMLVNLGENCYYSIYNNTVCAGQGNIKPSENSQKANERRRYIQDRVRTSARAI